PPLAYPAHFSTLCRALESAGTGGEAPPSVALHELAERARRRGLVIVLSDGFEPPDDLEKALRHLRHRRHEVIFFPVLAREEEAFPFRRPAKFRDLERPGREVLVDPVAYRPAYRAKFAAFRDDLRGRLRSMGADYHKAGTAEPAGRTLLDYLA